MDLQGLPAFQPADCSACKAIHPGICFKCEKKIPAYATDSGSGSPVVMGAGFKAPFVDHWHITSVGGMPGYSVISPELCRECYLAAYNEANPNDQLVLADLPKELNLT